MEELRKLLDQPAPTHIKGQLSFNVETGGVAKTDRRSAGSTPASPTEVTKRVVADRLARKRKGT